MSYNHVMNVIASRTCALFLLLCAARCTAFPFPATATPSITPTFTLMLPTPAPTVIVTPTPRDEATLKFWLPDVLAGLDNAEAGDVLAEQIRQFETANASIDVELRLRAAEGPGNILMALRTTAAVAPSAMPDITLLSYEDLRLAAQAGLVAPLDRARFPRIEEAFAPVVLSMGILEGQLYGLPSTIDLLHVALPGSAPASESWAFESLLQDDVPLLFAAAPTSGISDVFLLQYLTAGGSVVSGEALGYDEAALRAVLRYYERAVDADLIPADVLEYDVPDRYADALGEDVPVVTTSHLVLQAVRQGQALRYGYVPTLEGAPVSILNGWLWVITTDDEVRQMAALRFLNWMRDPARQAAYLQAIDRFPAELTAERRVNAEYAAFVAPLLENAILPPASYREDVLARALQNAFASVLSGQSTAEQALAAVEAQIGS